MAESYPCTRCEVEVTDDVEALQCDLCSGWEHRGCIRERDRPSVELYSAIMRSPSKAILFVCSKCRRKGDVARRLFQLESANERVNDRCQATERLLIERQALIEVKGLLDSMKDYQRMAPDQLTDDNLLSIL